MITNKVDSEAVAELYKTILKLKTVDDCRLLFEDLCTRKEIEQMAQRIKAAEGLIKGKTYQQVIADTDISSATLSRVSRCVQYGEGYSRFLGNKTEK